MKNLVIIILLISAISISCKKDKPIKKVIETTVKNTDLPFLGTWTRSFEMGQGTSANVTYTVYNDSIQYEMLGPMNMKYTLVKDVFVPKDNRWFGKRGETPYVIFFKNLSKDAITVLKMKVENKTKALEMAFPSDSARSKFSSWNTYSKK